MNDTTRESLARLFRATETAHRAATGGDDPDWPLWYAERLRGPLSDALGVTFTKSEIVRCLLTMYDEREVRADLRAWPEFAAERFVECFAESESAADDRLALYYSQGCAYCHRVLAAIERLDLDVELRDIFAEPADRHDLVAARGRGTVPVLRITAPDGSDRWMPESRDIVRYLERLKEKSRA